MFILILFLLIWACIVLLSLEVNYHKQPNRIFLTIILAAYIIAVLYVTLLNRTMGDAIDYELELFWSYKKMLVLPVWMSYFKEIVLNIVLFVPFGFLPAVLFKRLDSVWKIVMLAFVFSLYIEVSQLLLKVGLFEFDDLFDNTLGALIGYGIFYSISSLSFDSKGRRRKFLLGLMPFLIVSVFFGVIFLIRI